MKKLLVAILSLVLLVCLGTTALAETELAWYFCEEEGYSTKIPVNGSAGYREGTGLQIYLDVPGYPPYVIVSRRSLDAKFKDPTNFLNNVFREYLEGRYDSVGTTPAKGWDIGGKTLIGARYLLKDGDLSFVIQRLIEVRDDGDVEYTAFYLDGEENTVSDTLDAVVRYYEAVEVEAPKSEDSIPSETKELTQGFDREIEASPRYLEPEDALETFDPDNGIYWAQIPDPENIFNGGYFTTLLYTTDLYPASEIEHLKVGDHVKIHDQLYTVNSLVAHDDGGLELYPEEEFDGYIVFQSYDDTHYSVIVNDCTIVSFASTRKIMMPLPNDFTYGYATDGGVDLYDADAFVSLVTGEYPPEFTQYNTSVIIRDDLLMGLVHSDYPEGLGD